MTRPLTMLLSSVLASSLSLAWGGSSVLAQQERPEPIAGPYRAVALNFYFVHPGGPLQIALKATADDGPPGRRGGGSGTGTEEDPKILYRFFDHEENLVKWDYQRLRPGSATTWTHDYGREAPRGIYQVRYAGERISVETEATPARSFGLSPSRTMISYATKDQYASLWMWVPPQAGPFTVRGIGVGGRLADAQGKEVASFAHGKPGRLDGRQYRDALLRLEVKTGRVGDYYRFGFSGLDPVILAPDRATVEAIADGFRRDADGRLFAHRFQARMRAWIDSLKPEDLAIEPVNWPDYQAQWEAHPEEAAALLHSWGPFRHIHFLLEDQVVDPKHADFGQFKLRRAPATLALVYALDRPYNPYHKHPAIRNRLLLNVFRRLLEMNSNETWTTGDSNYSGADGLSLAHPLTTLYLGARAIDDEALRSLWIEGERRLIHRFPFYRVSADNQSSHWPLAYRKLFEVTGDAKYDRLARDYIAGMTLPEKNRFMATGYQGEAYGPDATYQGLGAANQAVYYRMSGDENALKGLKIIYNFFNHTVAPEPDGKVFGASGFSHRTQGSWVTRQYGGGLSYMAGELPEAAVWISPDYHPKVTAEEIGQLLRAPNNHIKGSPQVLGYATHVIGPYFRHMRYPAKPLPDTVLPVKARESFTTNFNDEFLAVRRPGYYFVGYLSGTAGEWTKSRRRLKPDNPHHNNVWNAIQGPQLFWTPGYGSLTLSMNWNGDTQHMVRADMADGRCLFPDYWATRSEYLAEGQRLTMKQDMIELPVRLERLIDFKADELQHTLWVRADEDVQVAALYEQLPLLLNKPGFELLFRRDDKWVDTPGEADAFWCGNKEGQGVLVTLDRSRTMTLGPVSEFRSGQKSRPLRIMLPSRMKADSVEKIELRMRGLAKADL